MKYSKYILISLIFTLICQTESYGWHDDNDQSNFSINQSPQHTGAREVVEVIGENTALYTPMGRDINSVVIYDDTYPLFYLPNGTDVILDYGLFLNTSTKRFTEDIDGRVSFDPDQVSVGLYLMKTLN